MLETHHLVCGPRVSPKGKKERRTQENKSEAFKDKGGRRLSGKEGVEGEKEEKKWRGGPCVNFKKPLTAAAAAAASPDHSTDAFVPCLLSLSFAPSSP